MGRDCRFAHDKAALMNAPDVNIRCFACSGLGHRVADCPVQKGGNSAVPAPTDGDVNKGTKGSGKGTAKGTLIRKVEDDKPLAGEQAKLISAAASLIEQMQAKASRKTCVYLPQKGACSELEGLLRKMVDLAQGSAELFVTACGRLVSMQEVETMVALGPLIKLGCRLQWTEGECALWHSTRKKRISLDVRSGCSRVSEPLALELIDEVEKYRVETIGAAVRAIRSRDIGTLPSPQEAVGALTQALLQDQGVAPCLGETVLSLWPQVPDDLLQDLTSWSKQECYNRRKRRAVQKAKRVIVHLFAGESRKEVERLGQARGYEVITGGAEEDRTQTFGDLARLAAAGKVDVWWGAPPCGTNTLCRFIRPGPRPLRGRSQDTRWGLPNLSEAEKEKVRRSDELYLRNLLLLHISHEANLRAQKKEPWDLIQNPQDPETYISEESSLWTEARRHGGFALFFATPEYQRSA